MVAIRGDSPTMSCRDAARIGLVNLALQLSDGVDQFAVACTRKQQWPVNWREAILEYKCSECNFCFYCIQPRVFQFLFSEYSLRNNSALFNLHFVCTIITLITLNDLKYPNKIRLCSQANQNHFLRDLFSFSAC